LKVKCETIFQKHGMEMTDDNKKMIRKMKINDEIKTMIENEDVQRLKDMLKFNAKWERIVTESGVEMTVDIKELIANRDVEQLKARTGYQKILVLNIDYDGCLELLTPYGEISQRIYTVYNPDGAKILKEFKKKWETFITEKKDNDDYDTKIVLSGTNRTSPIFENKNRNVNFNLDKHNWELVNSSINHRLNQNRYSSKQRQEHIKLKPLSLEETLKKHKEKLEGTTGFSIHAYDWITKELNTRWEGSDWILSKFLMSDMINGWEEGTTWPLMGKPDSEYIMKKTADSEYNNKYELDGKKYVLLTTQMKHLAEKYPNAEIDMYFFDDAPVNLKTSAKIINDKEYPTNHKHGFHFTCYKMGTDDYSFKQNEPVFRMCATTHEL